MNFVKIICLVFFEKFKSYSECTVLTKHQNWSIDLISVSCSKILAKICSLLKDVYLVFQQPSDLLSHLKREWLSIKGERIILTFRVNDSNET